MSEPSEVQTHSARYRPAATSPTPGGATNRRSAPTGGASAHGNGQARTATPRRSTSGRAPPSPIRARSPMPGRPRSGPGPDRSDPAAPSPGAVRPSSSPGPRRPHPPPDLRAPARGAAPVRGRARRCGRGSSRCSETTRCPTRPCWPLAHRSGPPPTPTGRPARGRPASTASGWPSSTTSMAARPPRRGVVRRGSRRHPPSTFTAAVAFAVAAGFAGRQIVRAWGSVSWQADVAAGIAAVPVLAAPWPAYPGPSARPSSASRSRSAPPRHPTAPASPAAAGRGGRRGHHDARPGPRWAPPASCWSGPTRSSPPSCWWSWPAPTSSATTSSARGRRTRSRGRSPASPPATLVALPLRSCWSSRTTPAASCCWSSPRLPARSGRSSPRPACPAGCAGLRCGASTRCWCWPSSGSAAAAF